MTNNNQLSSNPLQLKMPVVGKRYICKIGDYGIYKFSRRGFWSNGEPSCWMDVSEKKNPKAPDGITPSLKSFWDHFEELSEVKMPVVGRKYRNKGDRSLRIIEVIRLPNQKNPSIRYNLVDGNCSKEELSFWQDCIIDTDKFWIEFEELPEQEEPTIKREYFNTFDLARVEKAKEELKKILLACDEKLKPLETIVKGINNIGARDAILICFELINCLNDKAQNLLNAMNESEK